MTALPAGCPPRRIQRKRTKGWRMPEGAVYIGRPTLRGNPFIVGTPSPKTGEPMTAAECVEWYRRGIVASMKAWTGEPGGLFRPESDDVYRAWEERCPHLHATAIELSLEDLRGRDLVCWCRLCPEHKDGLPLGMQCEACNPCHANPLLELANL